MYEREKHHWWKTKKWAYFNLNRLFIRYVLSGSKSPVLVYLLTQTQARQPVDFPQDGRSGHHPIRRGLHHEHRA